MPYVEQPRVDYDQLAREYDARYAARPLDGIAASLREVVGMRGSQRVLEIGCGTGRWLEQIGSLVDRVYGADPSLEMLKVAARRAASPLLIAARANALPILAGRFDLIFCVNALHHFDDPRAFIGQVRELLKKAGTLAIIGIDPRLIKSWYLYEYFEGTYETDLRRYPSIGDIVNWMAAAGFGAIQFRVVETAATSMSGRAVLSDPFLKKTSNSLLALLTDEQYEAGLRRIESSIRRAEAEDHDIIFRAELPFVMITAY